MKPEQYIVDLTSQERSDLEKIVKIGKDGAYKIRHAQILLHSDKNGTKKTVAQITEMLHCHSETVCNVKKRFVEQGLEAALNRKKRNAG